MNICGQVRRWRKPYARNCATRKQKSSRSRKKSISNVYSRSFYDFFFVDSQKPSSTITILFGCWFRNYSTTCCHVKELLLTFRILFLFWILASGIVLLTQMVCICSFNINFCRLRVYEEPWGYLGLTKAKLRDDLIGGNYRLFLGKESWDFLV